MQVIRTDQRGQGGVCDGVGKRDKGAVAMRNGLEEFVAEEQQPMGSSYPLVVWGKLDKGTIDSYRMAIHVYIKFSQLRGWMSPRHALEGRLLQITWDGYYEGPGLHDCCEGSE